MEDRGGGLHPLRGPSAAPAATAEWYRGPGSATSDRVIFLRRRWRTGLECRRRSTSQLKVAAKRRKSQEDQPAMQKEGRNVWVPCQFHSTSPPPVSDTRRLRRRDRVSSGVVFPPR